MGHGRSWHIDITRVKKQRFTPYGLACYFESVVYELRGIVYSIHGQGNLDRATHRSIIIVQVH